MSTWYCQDGVTAGTGTGTSGDPYNVHDVLDGDTSLPGSNTLAANDIIVLMHDPDDAENTKFNITSEMRPAVDYISIRAGDVNNSGAYTPVRAILDGSGLAAGKSIIAINGPVVGVRSQLVFDSLVFRNAPYRGAYFAQCDTIAFDNCDFVSNGDTGAYCDSLCDNIFFTYCRAWDNTINGIVGGGDKSKIISCYSADNGGVTQLNASVVHRSIAICDGSGTGIRAKSASHNTCIHRGTSANTGGWSGIDSYETYISIDVGEFHNNIIVSLGSGTSRFAYPIDWNNSYKTASMTGNVSYNNQSDTYYLTGSTIAVEDGPTVIDPQLVGGDPFDATPIAELTGIVRKAAIGYEPNYIVPGAVQPPGGGVNRGILTGGRM